jgi:6-phosphogluconolactonase
MRAASLLALAAVLACTLGCGGGNHTMTVSPNTYAYVSAGGLEQFQVASDGTLTPLTPATIPPPTAYGLGFVGVDPSSQYLFASGIVANPMVTNQYMVAADGTLTANSTPTVSGGSGVNPFVFAPNGQFVIFPNLSDYTVSVYSLSSSGALTPVNTVSTYPFSPTSAAIDPSGKFVYVGLVVNGPDRILEYAISSNGTLTPLVPSSVVAVGVNNLEVSPKGFLYTVNGDAGTVTAFWIDESTGQLANAGSFPTGTGSQSGPDWITFDPTGAYAYVVNNTDSSVTQFTVNATTGALTMNGPDVPTGRWPLQLALDPSGKFAYVVNSNDGTISQFTVGGTGRLSQNGTVSLGAPFVGAAIAFAQR